MFFFNKKVKSTAFFPSNYVDIHSHLLPGIDDGAKEMSFFNPPYNLEELLIKIKNKDYTPILAHPERYRYYHNNFSQHQKLTEMGCFFQLNLLSLTTHYGKAVTKIAHKLLKKNQYTFLGSDTHHKGNIELMKTLMNLKTKDVLTPLFKKI